MKMYPKSKKGEYMSSIAHAHKEETVVEAWELNEMKMDDPKLLKIFDKLKKGSTVKIKIDSAISKGKDYREFTVTAKNIVGKGKRFEQEKITLKAKDNPTGVKHFLYNRDGKVTLAIGDMGASIAISKKIECQRIPYNWGKIMSKYFDTKPSSLEEAYPLPTGAIASPKRGEKPKIKRMKTTLSG